MRMPTLFAAATLLAAATTALAQQPAYTLELLPSQPDFVASQANGLNDLGQAVGTAQDTSGATFGVLWNADGSIVRLENLSTVTNIGAAIDINNAGTIIGDVRNDGDINQAARWDTNGALSLLGQFGMGTYSSARGINEAGVIVGTGTVNGPTRQHAFTWTQDDGFTDYGSFFSSSDTVVGGFEGINNNNTFVGTSYFLGSPFKAISASETEPDFVELSPPGQFSAGIANAVNDNGLIVGSQNPGSGGMLPAIFNGNGTATLLGDLGLANSDGSAEAVNNAGTIVGGISGFDDSNPFDPVLLNAAFIYQDGTLYNLTDVVGDDLGFERFIQIGDINENGVAVGHGILNGVPQAFILRPVPEPATLGSAAAAGLLLLRRRRVAG